ncbi:glycoside hydrolase family 76 protein [Arthrobacter sp. AL08]|uniref:glycoside hydrolase family 76 protein n=1 Tax=unclassified Arthrobacter TaxID=235627 RepID=UPI00249A5256|nr:MULTISPECIES: glycoside hydrolase family 76 protein [unclassified Arthrobacter]MDI3242714.1 glycoside hydrolase family 76 protein [Arthrobacter sp. AL05]MDI3278725.1 glycoside hydrolase family 76 protein [Arthrobacter sp. AL08]
MTPADMPPAHNWSFRADEAARSVTRMFGQRLFFLPGTHLAAIVRPSGRLGNLARPWHYWWQAHYVDCLVDAGRRELGREHRPGKPFDGSTRPSAGRLASWLVTGIRLRNFLTVVNNYYDDMAWLALSTLRLEQLAEDSRHDAGRRRNAKVLKSLTLQFDSASTDDLGGGTFWSTKRDFKNTPATAPVALHYARTGQPAKAQALLDWLNARLFDAEQGLYRDGLRITPAGGVVLEGAIYSYNQGPVLGALLELGGEANLARAAELVASVARGLTVPAALAGRTADVLRCEGTGDGGLFTGILARYLALAAADQRLPAQARATATTLVNNTAEAFWEGRRPLSAAEPLAGKGSRVLFSDRPERPALRSYPPGAAVELSTQLQAWMVLEAAAAIAARSGHPAGNESATPTEPAADN